MLAMKSFINHFKFYWVASMSQKDNVEATRWWSIFSPIPEYILVFGVGTFVGYSAAWR